MLCDVKISDIARVAAFLKRCASAMLLCGSSEAMAATGLMLRWANGDGEMLRCFSRFFVKISNPCLSPRSIMPSRVMRRYPRLLSMLEYEGAAPVGGRLFDASCPDPSEAGALAASLWELPVMTRHYHPAVGQAATSLLAMGLGAGGSSSNLSGPLAMAGTARDLAAAYDCSRGSFRPSPPEPKAGRRSGGPSGSVARRLQQLAAKPASAEELVAMLKKLQRGGSDDVPAEEGLRRHLG